MAMRKIKIIINFLDDAQVGPQLRNVAPIELTYGWKAEVKTGQMQFGE